MLMYFTALDAVCTCSCYRFLIAILARVAELKWAGNSYVIVPLSDRMCWVLEGIQ